MALLRNLRDRFFAAFYHRTITRYERAMGPAKQELFAGIQGRVLEIGPGPGSNLRHCRQADEWIGVEPNTYMHRLIRDQLRRNAVAGRLIDEPAELVELADASVDVVIGTLVLCSVEQPDQVLREIRRLLKPGGQYLFIEHVQDPDNSFTRRFQRLIRPCWHWCAAGCRADLDALSLIDAGGFGKVDARRFRVSWTVLPWFLTAHLAGCATKAVKVTV